MLRFADGGPMHGRNATELFLPYLPQALDWFASLAKDGFLPIFWIWQKSGVLDPQPFKLAGGRDKPREVFLVSNVLRKP